MNISPITGYPYCNKKISFGTIERTVYYPEDSEEAGKINYKNNSYMFRFDMNWNMVSNLITKNDKPKKIYCYA